jgi:hypothetical protein
MILFQDETQKLTKFTHFQIFIFIQQLLIKNIILRLLFVFLIRSYKIFHSKKIHMKK